MLLASAALAGPGAPLAGVPGANLQAPSWSPDGAQLSFEANFHEEKRIETWVGPPTADAFAKVALKARPTTKLTEGFATSGGSGGRVIHELAWSPAQRGAYVFVGATEAGDYDLFLTGGAPISPGPGADGDPRWTPAGDRLVFTSARTGEGDLYLLDARAMELPPRQLTALSDSSELYPDWSGDGASLVFVAHTRTGDNVWWLPTVDGRPEALTRWAGNQIRPRFSPTARLVAFYANREDAERWDLYVVAPGGEPRRLATDVHPDAHGPAFTADGHHVVFVADDDDALDPVRAVRVDDPTRVATLELGTVGHGDLAVGRRDGKAVLAYVAKGRVGDAVRDFDRLFVADLPPLP